ncbi:MAG: hypothetical protein ACOCVG_04090, partial [Verrucomicrobiota bacterium]
KTNPFPPMRPFSTALTTLLAPLCLLAQTEPATDAASTPAPAALERPASFKINVRAPADAVLPAERRIEAMQIADWLVNFRDPGFTARLDDLPNPFLFEQPLPEAEIEVEDTQPQRPTVSAQQILVQAGEDFSENIRGSLSLGGNAVLVLKGGEMARLGYTFTANPIDRPDQSFKIEVTEITTRNFTLATNGTSMTFALPEQGSGGSITRN